MFPIPHSPVHESAPSSNADQTTYFESRQSVSPSQPPPAFAASSSQGESSVVQDQRYDVSFAGFERRVWRGLWRRSLRRLLADGDQSICPGRDRGLRRGRRRGSL